MVLQKTVSSIIPLNCSSLFTSPASVDEEGRFECAWKLPDTLESLLASNTQVEAELTELRVRIQSLVHSIVEVCRISL